MHAVSKHKRHSRDVVLIKEVSQQNLTIWANLANNTHGLGLLLYHHILQHSSGLSLPQKTNRETNKKKLEIKSPEIFIVAVVCFCLSLISNLLFIFWSEIARKREARRVRGKGRRGQREERGGEQMPESVQRSVARDDQIAKRGQRKAKRAEAIQRRKGRGKHKASRVE